MTRRIPDSGINLFQLIYILVREYEERSGLPALDLSLGNPDGVPEEAVRRLQARFAADPGYDYHTYAEERDLNGFADGMVELHGGIRVSEHPHLAAVPIPGIKSMTALASLACGLHRGRRADFRAVSNLPAYDVIGTWSGYLGAERIVWPLVSGEGMRPSMDRLEAALKGSKNGRADLILVIRPGNPASVGASAEEWKALIEHCIEHETRLVNDAAYAGLTDESHVPLAAVAKDYTELEWLELYSVSKSFSDPGARLGAAVGHKDFIQDLIMVKGNTDSGPSPALMAAYGEFFKDRAAARSSMERLRDLYRRRLDYVVPKLREAGLREACRTDAGFFTLWKVPKRVLGADLAAGDRPPHEAFNQTVIDETGIVGVHFMGSGDGGKPEPMVRYAVCTDVLDKGFQSRFEEQLARLRPEY